MTVSDSELNVEQEQNLDVDQIEEATPEVCTWFVDSVGSVSDNLLVQSVCLVGRKRRHVFQKRSVGRRFLCKKLWRGVAGSIVPLPITAHSSSNTCPRQKGRVRLRSIPKSRAQERPIAKNDAIVTVIDLSSGDEEHGEMAAPSRPMQAPSLSMREHATSTSTNASEGRKPVKASELRRPATTPVIMRRLVLSRLGLSLSDAQKEEEREFWEECNFFGRLRRQYLRGERDNQNEGSHDRIGVSHINAPVMGIQPDGVPITDSGLQKDCSSPLHPMDNSTVSSLTFPPPSGEVAALLAELALDADDAQDYWVRGSWDIDGLRSDVALHWQQSHQRSECNDIENTALSTPHTETCVSHELTFQSSSLEHRLTKRRKLNLDRSSFRMRDCLNLPQADQLEVIEL